MEFSAENGCDDQRIVAWNDEPMHQQELSQQWVQLLLQKQARAGLNPILRHF
jgi:hypothetical protein